MMADGLARALADVGAVGKVTFIHQDPSTGLRLRLHVHFH